MIQIEVPSDKFAVGTVLFAQEWGEEIQRWYWGIWIKVARTKWVDECGHPFTYDDMYLEAGFADDDTRVWFVDSMEEVA